LLAPVQSVRESATLEAACSVAVFHLPLVLTLHG
jgi:hypothetical protein